MGKKQSTIFTCLIGLVQIGTPIAAIITGNRIILLLALFLWACNFLYLAWSNYVVTLRINSWSQTLGSITRSKVGLSHSGFEDSEGVDSSHSSFKYNLSYTYSVEDKSYTGILLSYAPFSESEHDVHMLVAKYPVGKRVPVFFNPKNPSMACLEKTKPSSNIFFFFILGVGLMLVFIHLALNP